jgi:hypothetical protein
VMIGVRGTRARGGRGEGVTSPPQSGDDTSRGWLFQAAGDVAVARARANGSTARSVAIQRARDRVKMFDRRRTRRPRIDRAVGVARWAAPSARASHSWKSTPSLRVC